MSLRAPRRSEADGLSENVLKAILEPQRAGGAKTGGADEDGGRNTNTDHEERAGHRASILETTTVSTCSKRSLHSSRLTLSDTKEFYKTVGCRWIRAVRQGDANTVKKMLEEKPELVHYAPMYGPFALHIATARGDRSIILLLKANGADIDTRDAAGYTSLQVAIRRGDQSLAHFLVSQGADVNVLDPNGLHITDYEQWSEEDHVAAEHARPILRPKAHSFIGSPTSITSGTSNRTVRPSSTPDTSMCSENEKEVLKRDGVRTSWKSFFGRNPITKKFTSNSKL